MSALTSREVARDCYLQALAAPRLVGGVPDRVVAANRVRALRRAEAAVAAARLQPALIFREPSDHELDRMAAVIAAELEAEGATS